MTRIQQQVRNSDEHSKNNRVRYPINRRRKSLYESMDVCVARLVKSYESLKGCLSQIKSESTLKSDCVNVR